MNRRTRASCCPPKVIDVRDTNYERLAYLPSFLPGLFLFFSFFFSFRPSRLLMGARATRRQRYNIRCVCRSRLSRQLRVSCRRDRITSEYFSISCPSNTIKKTRIGPLVRSPTSHWMHPEQYHLRTNKTNSSRSRIVNIE